MVDPANTALGKMLTEEITPVVMVLRTSLVEETCQKNGLSFIKMLTPFSVFDNIDVPVRTASDQPYRLQKFKLRFFYASDIQKPNLQAAKERLEKVITEAGEKDTSDYCSELANVEKGLTISESELSPSWFQVFNKELAFTSSFSDHEAFDHPVACLLVVSSKDEEPVNKFVDLFNTNQLPSILSDGVMDPKVLKQYLLLHDNQDEMPDKASKILSEMKSTFGSSDCRLLCINSLQDGLLENENNPWSSYNLDASLAQHLGCFLSVDDIDEIKLLIQDLSAKHIIPHMEQKIRILNQQVSSTRKGFRNQIKNLWWRKGKEDAPDTPNGPVYTYNSIESQIRVLGDYAFMLRDYELALSNYRLISMDYKLDKAWKRYAGVQEMMGLTYFMLDHSRKEAEYCMENAFSTYLKVGAHGQQNSIRCGLWWAELLKARDQYKEAAIVYFRISSEDPLQSAVMLEQASYCYLLMEPPMFRKYGFHRVLSGDSYEKCDQVKHAIRTYRSALSVFKGSSWSLIRDHTHFQLGKWFASLGMFDAAIKHMLEILACEHQSKAVQELFLQDFILLVQKTGKTLEVWGLQLPIIKLSLLRVIFEDHRTYASPAAVGIRESLWRSLEEDMIPLLSTAKSNWLELQTKLVSKKHKESNICVAGEAIKVDIGFKNPLQIPISISNVSLICKHSASSDSTEVDELNSAANELSSVADGQIDEDLTKLISRDEGNAENYSFTLSEAEFSLSGGETLVVQLTVTPRVEGILNIVGVKWKLSGCVVGFQSFKIDHTKNTAAKGRIKHKLSPSDEMRFLVVKSLPRLEGFIHHFPTKSYHGELHRLVLELKNQSNFPVKNMKMKISHPRFLLVGDREVKNSESAACLIRGKSERSGVSVSSEEAASLFNFPEDSVIHGEEPLLWSLWLRAAVLGSISLCMTIYYELEDISTIMRYRILRMCYNLEVLPSIVVSFKISHCPLRLQEVLVCMNVVNKTSSESFQIHQLSAVGNQWELTMLQSMDIPLHSVTPGQSLSCFFKLENVRERLTSEDKVVLDGIRRSHVRLGTQGGKQELFDTISSLVADFHHQERFHQGMSDQGHPDAVDFVLIFQPHNKSQDQHLLEYSRLFTHHVCHCSVVSRSPIDWVMDGPQIIHHDFTMSFCKINLRMTIHNSLDAALSVHINTYDKTASSITSQSSDSTGITSENKTGWHDLSLANDVKQSSDILGSQFAKQVSPESVSPFIWSGSSSTSVDLGPLSTAEVPLQICMFAPGVYDISSYQLNWNLHVSNNQSPGTLSEQSLGTCAGSPFYLTVLQST
ncbi:hypothetical protein Nepgr_031801 [Nepenthes gracilis]|uniref:Trafficking protein particle complex subunit 8 n=1 Tax=Nepenthes gracilis TaxID=150966 RepID=A0AAD3THE7_NEPGR|nr:hypothetical protein Nepgr_031801 [Nepenthes gracilis]